MKNIYKRINFALFALLVSQSSYAQGSTPWQTFLDKIVEALTGTAGRSIAIIGIAVAGIMMLTGRIQMMLFLTILAGIVTLFSAAQIVDWAST
ncbi:MAG: TrbC/VirB2 family protein [Flavobacteriaceae bacterium]